jgi:hypothetical protein
MSGTGSFVAAADQPAVDSDQAIRDLARQWTGPPIALELTGPAGGPWTIGAGRPTAALRADTIAYLRALAGRDDAVESARRLIADPAKPGALAPAQAYHSTAFLDFLIPHGIQWTVEDAPAT